MPKRTRQQQDKHNENRRLTKKEGRKTIVCMKYIKVKYPNIHDEACDFFDLVNKRYPGKRDLTRTYEFSQIKDQHVQKNTMLEPELKIELIPNNITPEEDILQVFNMESEEINKIIEELRKDPNLASAFDDVYTACETTTVEEMPPIVDNVKAYTACETTTVEEMPPIVDNVKAYITCETTTVEEMPPLVDESQKVDQIIQEIHQDPELSPLFHEMEEFNALGENFSDISDDDEIFW